jgi:hypothetical protein
MAARKFSPFPVFTQSKDPVYQALSELNLDFEALAKEIKRLEESKAIPRETIQLYRSMIEELRATINHRVTGILHMREAKDAYRFGKFRQRQEKRKTS